MTVDKQWLHCQYCSDQQKLETRFRMSYRVSSTSLAPQESKTYAVLSPEGGCWFCSCAKAHKSHDLMRFSATTNFIIGEVDKNLINLL